MPWGPLTGVGKIGETLGVLGQAPNVVPAGQPSHDDSPRSVIIGSHPVGGILSTLLLEPGRIGLSMIGLDKAPNPTFHWAVIVGDFYHELNADKRLDVIYQNGKPVFLEHWSKYVVGSTTFNDVAIKEAGEVAIQQMAKAYNAYNNNCQKFVLNLLALICKGPYKVVHPSYALTENIHISPFSHGKSVVMAKVFHEPVTEDEHKAMVQSAETIMAKKTASL